MYFRRGFKFISAVLVFILIFAQCAMAAPVSIYYQDANYNMIKADYQTAMLNKVQNNPAMFNALQEALSNAELKNLPIFFTDDSGKVINYEGALEAGETYSEALGDSNVNNAAVPAVNGQMNPDGTIVPIGSSNTAAKIANVSPADMLNPIGLDSGSTVIASNAESAASGSQVTISGTLQDTAGNPVSNAQVAIQDYDVLNSYSNNVQNDAFVSNGTTTLFSAMDYPVVTTDSLGNFSITVTANVPVTQSILDSITRYYAYYVPSSVTVSNGQALPMTVTPLSFVNNLNSGNFLNLIWQQGQLVQSVGVSHTSLLPSYSSCAAVPQTAAFSNVVGDVEQVYAAAYNQSGSAIAPAAGNQFDGYTLTYDLTAPAGIQFVRLGIVPLPLKSDGTGIARIQAAYNQYTGFVLHALYYADGSLCYSDGTQTTAATPPAGFDPAAFGLTAYDGSGQITFCLNSDQSAAIKTSGISGSVNLEINAYSNTSTAGVIDTTYAQGSAVGTVNATFNPSNAIGSLGLAADALGFSGYMPLLEGNAAPPSSIDVGGLATPGANLYAPNSNCKFFAAPFNSYPAIATIPNQGLTLTMVADKNGIFSNVDGYVLSTAPTNLTVNINSAGEVSVNNVKLWTAATGYKVVGYMPAEADQSVNILEEGNTAAAAGNFVAYKIAAPGDTPTQIAAWTVDKSALAADFEGYLGFEVVGGQLVPQTASYYASYSHFYTPLAADTSTGYLPDGVFLPVTASSVYVSDKNCETTTITVSNSLNSSMAVVTANFTAARGGVVAVQTSPASFSQQLGGSQNITLTAQDVYGNPIADQTIYLGTDRPRMWMTQVNGTPITGTVNMGSLSSPSMLMVNTPVPLFKVDNPLAYASASAPGLTAYNLSSAPCVALTTGADGTVSFTLADGNVTYVANTATSTMNNNSAIDPGQAISQFLGFYADATLMNMLGSVLVNWGGTGSGTGGMSGTGFTFNLLADNSTGNTIVVVTGTAADVTGITVKGEPATYISAHNTWLAILNGLVPVNPSDIVLSTAQDAAPPTISSVSPVNVTTQVGVAPVLPSTVTATMSDGTTQDLAVDWADVPTSQYANAGAFTVTGTLANSTVTATANVTVQGDFTFTTVSEALTGNTIVNVKVTAQNVTGVTVKGLAAAYLTSVGMWRAILPGQATVSSADIVLTTSSTAAAN